MPATSDAQTFRWGAATPSALYMGPTKVWPAAPTALLSEDFSSGTWDAWTNNTAYGGTAAVVSGVGNLVRTSGASWSMATGSCRYRALAAADFEILFDFTKDTAWACSLGVALRMPSNVVAGGLSVWINPDNTWQLEDGATTRVAPVSFPQTSGAWYRVRIRLVGSQVSGRCWTTGDAEPGTWSWTTSAAAVTAAGNLGFCNVGDSSGTRTVGLDNIIVTAP